MIITMKNSREDKDYIPLKGTKAKVVEKCCKKDQP